MAEPRRRPAARSGSPPLLAAAALACSLVVLACWLGACGSGGNGSGELHRRASGSNPSPRLRHAVADFDSDDYEAESDADDDDSSPPRDRDGDSDGEPGSLYDQDDADVVGFGHPASAGQKRQVSVVVGRYFTAVVAGDGRAACALMLRSVAARTPEVLGKPPRPPYVRGSRCPQIAASVFAFYARQLRAEAGALEVAAVRVRGASALAILAFRRAPTLPMRVIELGHERYGWRIDGLLDNELH